VLPRLHPPTETRAPPQPVLLCASVPMKAPRRSAVSTVMPRRPLTISLMRCGGTPIAAGVFGVPFLRVDDELFWGQRPQAAARAPAMLLGRLELLPLLVLHTPSFWWR